jgi:hypothetical protein
VQTCGWIRQTLRCGNHIDTDTDRNGLTAIRHFVCFEQDAGELGTVGQHVIWPFERDAGLTIQAMARPGSNSLSNRPPGALISWPAAASLRRTSRSWWL